MKQFFVIILIIILLTGCSTSAANQAPDDPISEQAKEILSSLTLEEKIGQMFIARHPQNDALANINRYNLGGYILFAPDFEDETPDTVRVMLQNYQNSSNIPMFIAVDEEGGKVNRISMYPSFRNTPFPSSRVLYKSGGLAQIRLTECEKAQLLTSLGINVNFAPVCDITTDPSAFMYDRSLGESPTITGEFVKCVIEIGKNNHIGNVLKHFPGYGNNTDTHIAIATDNRPLSVLENADLVPFKMAIEAGCDAIMVSHIYINAIDPHFPATLSPAVHQYLRNTMNFDGVIVTDDLYMNAITDNYGVEESAVLAVLAGNDLLCVTDFNTQYNAVLQAVLDNRISEQIINDSVLRILKWKIKLGLFDS